MIEIHKQICVDKHDSRRIEREFIKKYNANMNMIRAFRTEEQRIARRGIYRENNLEKERLRDRLYALNNPDKIKQKYIDNKERLQQKYIDNKETLNAKIKCSCGGSHTNRSKLRHFSTNKHTNYEASLLK